MVSIYVESLLNFVITSHFIKWLRDIFKDTEIMGDGDVIGVIEHEWDDIGIDIGFATDSCVDD